MSAKTKAKGRPMVPHHRCRQSSRSQQPDFLANWQPCSRPTKQQPQPTKMLNWQILRHLSPSLLRRQGLKKPQQPFCKHCVQWHQHQQCQRLSGRAQQHCAASNAPATKDTMPGNINQDKPSVPLVTKSAQTIGSLLSQCPTTTTTSATNRPTAKQKLVAKRQTPPVPTTNGTSQA